MYFIYILESELKGYYYIGYSHDPDARLMQHNQVESGTYTSKHRPWKKKAIIPISESEAQAIRVERYIKSQKQRRFITLVIENSNDPSFIQWLKEKSSAG